MLKEYFIHDSSGHNVGPTGGMYEREAAEEVARNTARRNPGKTFRVIKVIAEFKVLRK